MMRRHPSGQNVIAVEESLSRREMVVLVTCAVTVVVTIAAAVAVWRISTGIMWAVIILSIGSGGQMLLVGAGMFVQHIRAGRALVIEATGRAESQLLRAKAEMIAARSVNLLRPHSADKDSLDKAA